MFIAAAFGASVVRCNAGGSKAILACLSRPCSPTTKQAAPDRRIGTFSLAGSPLAPFPLASRLLTMTVTTAAFDRSSTRQSEASPYKVTSKGPPSSLAQYNEYTRSWHNQDTEKGLRYAVGT